MRNDAADFAARLYARIPEQYRVYDDERGRPLFTLVSAIAEQVAHLRNDLDRLWDNFFIETCDDWVVPYLGALVGANLVQTPIGRGNRLEVRDTIDWRRRRGTVGMLRDAVAATSGWPCDVAEFFQHLGWSQNMNHRRLDHPLTPSLRSSHALSLLGRANDSFAHAADFRAAHDLVQPRIGARLTTPGIPAWETPGRHQIPNLGFFVRRLQTFALHGVTPANGRPAPLPRRRAMFTFDPLFRDTPLFEEESAAPITRAAFEHDPWRTWGRDLAVRRQGILIAAANPPQASLSSSSAACTFGGRSNITLDPSRGMVLLDARAFALGGAHFVITAHAGATTLGTLRTLHAALQRPAFQAGSTATGALSIKVALAVDSTPARFPGAVVAIRATPQGFVRTSDALYVYLPPLFLDEGHEATFYVADDGSTYTDAALDPAKLARESEGSVFPPCVLTRDGTEVTSFAQASVVVVDPQRLAGINASITTKDEGRLVVHIDVPAGTAMPSCEIVVTNPNGESLLIYLPELAIVLAGGQDLLVGADGSTWYPSGGIARASAGQALPIAGEWPLRQRIPVSMNLCHSSRRSLLHFGELGIDPELGRWALPRRDPLLLADRFSVDYVEAFSAPIGARTFDRHLEDEPAATRIVSKSGGPATAYATLSAAIAASSWGDVIEIADSATYVEPAPIDVTKSLAIRAAAGERPCLAFYDAAGPLATNFRIPNRIDSFELNGLLLSGGTLTLTQNTKVRMLTILACTLDPVAHQPALLAPDTITAADTAYLVCRSITGALRIGSAPALTIADSIVDCQEGLAIAGTPVEAGELASLPSAAAAGRVQLERVTLLGALRCDVLHASESILDEHAFVDDQQSGCVRYSRWEHGSVLPRRFECVPSESMLQKTRPGTRAVAPLFNSRRADRCDYAQLAFRSAPEIETASEERSEIGAFARVRNPIRLANARTKLREFMPAGLTAVFIAET